MAVLDLSGSTPEEFSEGAASVGIKHYVHGKEGGAVLDATGFPDSYIYQGHGVLLDSASGDYKPQPVDGSIPVDHSLVGVVRSTTSASKPSVGVMTQGTINNNALKYPFDQASLDALQAIGIYNQPD